MSEPIPEDVMQRARDIWRRLGFVNDRLNQVPDLARALMEERRAERERCARKCEGDFDSEMRSYGDWFAREIRGQP